MLNKYKVVLFDLDDTLSVTMKVKWEQHKRVAKELYGIELTDQMIVEHWGIPLQKLLLNLYQTDDVDLAFKNYERFENEYPKELQAETKRLLKRLDKKGIQYGIVTATVRKYLDMDMKRWGFDTSKFLLTQTADESEYHKPDPRVFDTVLQKLAGEGIEKKQVIYIGDALVDYQAAKAAGIAFMGVTTGLVNLDEFNRAGAQAVTHLLELG